MVDDISRPLSALLGGVITIIAVAAVLAAIANTGLSLEPGDPFYIVWLDVGRYGEKALLLAFGVVGVAGAYLYDKFFRNSGF